MKEEKENIYLGIDVGSVSTNTSIINERGNILHVTYKRTKGTPLTAIQGTFTELNDKLNGQFFVNGVGATGSGRKLTGLVVGADVIKNEITAHAMSAMRECPDVQTVIEIGGQDSKIILIREGVVVDFSMNTVCAAGTGSFLDQTAARLDIPVEEFGDLALKSRHPTHIAGRCTVFSESDMIHKQQLGHPVEDIVAGLCEALVRNFINNVARGKEIRGPILFQGGVAANEGIRRAFEKYLKQSIIVPENCTVMGAVGAAFLAQEARKNGLNGTRFRGFDGVDIQKIATKSFECEECPNHCEILRIFVDGEQAACWGSRCGKWS